MSTYRKAQNRWTFETHRFGTKRTTPLTLVWELNRDPISDDYTPDEITAAELMRIWLRNNPDTSTGLVPIYWFVVGEALFEAAPHQHHHWINQHFLTYYTTPQDAAGRPINWCRLPVADKLWTPRRGDKGGFIQTATGWKPSPMQPTVPLPLLTAAYLSTPS